MDKHEKMHQMYSQLAEMADKLDKMGDLGNLMDTLLDNDGIWQRGVLFGMVRAKIANAETLVRSASWHLKYHIDEAKRVTAEEDGA